jgi:hypothetical protein
MDITIVCLMDMDILSSNFSCLFVDFMETQFISYGSGFALDLSLIVIPNTTCKFQNSLNLIYLEQHAFRLILIFMKNLEMY